MNKEIDVLRQLFDRLHHQQQTVWYDQGRGREPSSQAREAWNDLIIRFSPMGQREFEYWFPVSAAELHVDFSEKNLFLYLPPLEKNAEFVPILDMECHLDETRKTMKLRMMLVRLVEAEEEGKKKLCGVGFRLENPEGDNQGEERTEEEGEARDGSHDFYHAQLIKSLDGKVECPTWLPCTQPSFPLPADCPVTLVLCLLLTLYGKRTCWQFVSEDTGFKNLLRSYMDSLQHWIKWEEFS